MTNIDEFSKRINGEVAALHTMPLITINRFGIIWHKTMFKDGRWVSAIQFQWLGGEWPE